MQHAWDRLIRQLRNGAVNRRDFLAAAAALGVTAATAKSALAQVPKRGGHLIVGFNEAGTQDSLDPATWNSAWMQNAGPTFYDTLTMANEKLELIPMMAESYEPKAGAKEWVFKLRKGMTFHNGKDVTPADIIYSFNHHRGPDSKSMAKSLFAGIDDIKATGPNEITFVLASPNVDLPFMFTDGRTGIVPEGSNFDGMGSGPYVMDKFEPGVRISGKRFANDWNQKRGWVDSVEILGINDPTARISALLSGAVHLINRVATTSADQLKQNKQVQVYAIAGSSHPTFAMLTDKEPYNNLDLRLALKYSIDREAILKTVFRGYGLVGNDQPIPPSYPFYAKDVPQRKFDPDKTKFHLKKSGYTGPIVLTASDNAFQGAVESAQVWQASAKKAGIDLQIDRVPNDGYFSKYWGKVPLCASTWGGKATSDLLFALEFSSTSPINETHWKSEKFDQLLTASRAELDKTKRTQMYHDMQMLVHEEAGTILPIYNATVDAAAKNIGGFVATPVQQMAGYRATQQVWFKS